MNGTKEKGIIFNIQGYSIHDGPGIRTTVFFKGCPLKCLWCANPESQKNYPELFHNGLKCVRCYRCLNICPKDAVSVVNEGDFPDFNREICKNCEEKPCVDGCYESALEIAGYYIGVDELFEEICKDIPFFENSGGGVTFSGGEALSQGEFLIEVMKRCREKGIHITLDTCGSAPWNVLEKVLKYTDLVLFDIKVIDDEKHVEYTGVSNKMILKNAERIAADGKAPLIIRFPVIPGYNDSRKEIDEVVNFCKKIGAKEVNLVPYHGMASSKYDKLGIDYTLLDVSRPEDESLENIQSVFVENSVACSIQ